MTSFLLPSAKFNVHARLGVGLAMAAGAFALLGSVAKAQQSPVDAGMVDRLVRAAEKITLGPKEQPRKLTAIGSKQRREVRIRTDLPGASVVYDARGQNLFFPLPKSPRRFATLEEFARAIRTKLNGRIYATPEGKPMVAIYAVQIGASYWVPPAGKVIYRVADPVRAWVGGESGQVVIGKQSLCIDADGSCASGLPSYLVPVMRKAARFPSHVRPDCTGTGEGQRCVEYHSFFNKVELYVLNWARHGANTTLTLGSAGEVNRLIACPAGTPSPDADLPTRSLTVTLKTGEDGLRSASEAMLTITLAASAGLPPPPSEGALPPFSLNERRELRSDSLHTTPALLLPEGTRLGHISRMSITHVSRARMATDTRDNWNLNEINIRAEVSEVDETGSSRWVSRDILGRHEPHYFSGEAPTLPLRFVAGEAAAICFDPVSEPIRLAVDSVRLQARNWSGGLSTVALLSGVYDTGVEQVESAVEMIGAGVQTPIDPDFLPTGVGPGAAPADAYVWATDGVCGEHSASGFESGRTGNADRDCP